MTRTVNLLLVEDDRSVQRVLVDALTKKGFTVTAERDGEWAVKTFGQKRFDAVILDLLLPAMSGFEVAKNIRTLPGGAKVPLLMISGVYVTQVHQDEAQRKYGACALLPKPIDLNELTATLRKAMGDRYPTVPLPKTQLPPAPPAEGDTTGELLADDRQKEEAASVETEIQVPQRAPPEAPWLLLQKRPFAELVADAFVQKFNGALRLRRGKAKKIIYFRGGTPELVQSNLLSECLGLVLVDEKMISEDECQESLRRLKSSHRLQGTILIEMGCLSPHNLQHALVLQLQRKMYDAFSWDDGEYQFLPGAKSPSEPIAIELTCAQLIHEGVSRTYNAQRLARVFSGHDFEYVHPSADPATAHQDAGLGTEEAELLRLADGHKTLSTLRAAGVLPPFETDRFFYAMKCAHMVTFVAQQAALPRQPSSRPAEPSAPSSSAKPPPLPPKPAVIAKSVGSLLPELSDVVSLPRVSNQEAAKREALISTLAEMKKADFFELLGVARHAGREEIKRAYFAKARDYHPDKHFVGASNETRAISQHIYELISTAHDTLTNPEERQRYLDSLARPQTRPDESQVGKLLLAEGKFQRGEQLMRSHHYHDARQLFLEAIELCPYEGEFHAWAGWALFREAPSSAHEAMVVLEHAITLSPKLDKCYLFLGQIYQSLGRPDRAERQFEKAIQCNPDCTEALHELRLLERRPRS